MDEKTEAGFHDDKSEKGVLDMTEFPRIPGYRITRILGEGGMATVYLGIQEKLNRNVAIKVMNPRLLKDQNFSKRFLREAETAANLNHSNIISIFDIAHSGENHYIVMEYLPQSLKHKLQTSPDSRLEPSMAMKIAREIAAALDYAHRQGFVHRDIKPENIMFRQDGTPVLGDFGIARAVNSTTRLTRTGMSVGTPHYMSPEQCRAEKLDGRSDLYSLGIVLFEMMTGRLPFDADSEAAILLKHLQAPPPTLPAALHRYQPIIERLLAKERDNRVPDGSKLIALIKSIEENRFTPENGMTIPPEQPEADPFQKVKTTIIEGRTTPRWNKLFLSLGFVLVVVTGISIYFFLQKTAPPVSNDTTEAPQSVDHVEKSAPDKNGKEQTGVTREPEPSQSKRVSTPSQDIGEKSASTASRKKPDLKPTPPTQKSTVSESIRTGYRKPEKKSQVQQTTEEGPEIKVEKVAPADSPKPESITVETVNFFSVHPEVRKKYYEAIKQIEIPGLPAGIWVSDQISLNLAVDDRGKIYILDTLDKYLTIKPETHKADIKQMIEKGIHGISLPPPHDNKGAGVRIRSWRLNFKAASFHDKIVLELIQ